MRKKLLWTSNPDLEKWCQTHPSAGGHYSAKRIYEANAELLSEFQRRCVQFAVPNGILAFGTDMVLGEGSRPVAVELPDFASCLHPIRAGLAEFSLFVTDVHDLYAEEVYHGLLDRHLFRAFRFGVSSRQKATLINAVQGHTANFEEVKDLTFPIGTIFSEIFCEIDKKY